MIPEKQHISLTGCTCLILLLFLPVRTVAATYILHGNDSVIGQLRVVTTETGDTLLDIARTYGFGYQEMKLLNPEVDTWLPPDGQQVALPSQFVLPMTPREGIVLNIPEMRLYYYPPVAKGEPKRVITYPLGVGREGWSTPYVNTKIIQKIAAPKWYPPESIRQEHAAMGDILPEVVEAGPDNPLGDYALRLGMGDYLIHGTNKPYGVGMRVSHGCIRLYPENIEDLFQLVDLKTPVQIVNQPYKVGVQDGIIYLEAHPFLVEDSEQYENNLTSVVKLVIAITGQRNYEIDWTAAYRVINVPLGIPVAIGTYLPGQVHVSDGKIIDGQGITKADGIDLRLETHLSD